MVLISVKIHNLQIDSIFDNNLMCSYFNFRRLVGTQVSLQGNLDPTSLYAPKVNYHVINSS